MKTIFKRAAAWLMAVMMIVNCIPVYAQDSATDYSGQEISLADLMTTATDDVTVTFRIDNANYTQDSGSGYTHITSKSDLGGTDLQYESWAGVYKVTGTGVVCTYTIPAGTSLSANELSFPPLSVVNINDNINPNAVTYTSMVTWVDQGGMIYSADTVFNQDTTLTLQLYANDSQTGIPEIYSLDFVCSEDNHSIKSIGSFNLGQSVSQAHIDAATEAANAFTSQWCSYGPASNQILKEWRLKKTESGEMDLLEAGKPITADYVNAQFGTAIKVYAVWGEATSTPVTATFQYITKDENGADVINVIEERSLNSGDVLGELPGAPAGAPEGSTFVGWQYTEGDEQKFATPETVITADTVFNAVFSSQVKATFRYIITNAEGVQTETVVAERFLNPGDALGTLPSMTAYEHDGRSFIGWQYEEKGELKYATRDTVITEDTVYTAVFSLKATFQYVYYEEDGTEATKDIAVYKLKPGDPLGALPDMSAYETAFEIFDGWQYAVDENGEPQYATPDMIVNEDITLTAVFVEPELGEVIFHDVLPDNEIEISEFMPVGMTLAEVLEYIGYAPDDGYEVSECIWRTADGALADMNAVVTAENPIEVFTYTYRIILTLNPNSAEETAAPGTRALVETETAADGTITMTITAREGEPLTAADFITAEGIDLTRYVWKDKDGKTLDLQNLIDEGLTEDITATSEGTLTADAQNHPRVRFMLEGGTNAVFAVNLSKGTNLYSWIEANGSVDTSHSINGNPVKLGAFHWKNSDGSEITADQTVEADMDVIGALDSVTVTFYSDSSKTQQVGNTLTLAYGEKVSAGNFPTVDAVQGDKSFVEWRFTGIEGEIRFDADTPVYENMEVYAHYAQMHTLTFYTDSTKTTVADTVKTPDNEPFDTGKYPAVTPPEGQALRYWAVIKDGGVQVFNPQLPVMEDMELYPVFDKYVFVLMDADTGKKITSIYEGAPVNFTVDAPEGYYYVGVRLEDGTLIETDGTEAASTDLFKVTDAVNGQYQVNVTPVFDKQLKVVYHADAGTIFLAAPDASELTQTVSASVRLPGEMDIVRVDGSVGLVLDGWATTPGATTPQFEVSEMLTNEQLEVLQDENGEIHLYPVWAQTADAVKVTFISNYPADAVDKDGNALTEQRYTVYLKSGAKPVMPTLAETGMTEPSNTFEKTVANPDGTNTATTEQKYVLSGWSVDQSGVGDKTGTQQGVYVVESQYQSAITQDIEFYAIWIDEDVEDAGSQAYFFIRMDGTIPQEPGGYTPSGYFPNGAYYGKLTGYIKSKINIVNDPEKVQKNIHTAPSAEEIIEQIENSLTGSNEYGWTDTTNSDGEIVYRGETLTADNYGTVWTIEWYACKIADDGKTQWNVDGRVRLISEYELTYWPNGGTSQNIPPAEMHKANESVTIKYLTNNNYPQRDGYTFVGWSKNKNTTWQAVEAAADGADDGIWKKDSSEKLIKDASKEDLYAIWKPDPIDFGFSGTKFILENGQKSNATERFLFLIEKQNADGTYTEVGTEPSNGWGNFSYYCELDTPGLHTYRVTEVKGSDSTIVYDNSVYIITVYIGEGEQGLYKVGYTSSKNNVIQESDTLEFVNRRGERDVSVTKVWDDNNDQDGIRPSYVFVDLLQDGETNGQYQVQMLNAANGWSATWTGLPIATGDTQHVYTIRESQVGAGYTSTTTGDMDTGFTITNKHVPETTEVTVTKQWADDSNATGVRPSEIELTLTGSDGSTRNATLSGTGDSWTYTFTNLPVYYNGGAQITYTVDETNVPAGYTKTVNGYTVTNTLQSDLTFIVNKEIEGNMADPNKEFEFAVDILAANGTTVLRTETFKLKHNGTKTITGIPYGAYVQVTEDPAGYKAQHVLGTETVDGESYTTEQPITENGWGVTFINTNEVKIDTGVDLDGLPYTLLFLGAAGLGVLWMLLLIARRSRDEE